MLEKYLIGTYKARYEWTQSMPYIMNVVEVAH